MGVKFKDIVISKPITFKDLDGKIIAIDAANMIYQFLAGIRQKDGTPLTDDQGRVTSHLSGLLYRTSSLREKGIKPILVFDGKSNPLKYDTINKRVEIRKDSEKKWKDAKKKGDIETARKFGIRSSRMSSDIVESSKYLAKLLGIPCVQANSEGEAQASYMVEKGDAWAVASQDYDCLLFGAPRIIRNLTLRSGSNNLEFMELQAVLTQLDITREQLIDLALLVGTDFNTGIKGIGAKTGLKLIKNEKSLINVLKKKNIDLNNFGPDPQVLQDIFLKHDTTDDYQLEWNVPNKEELINFLCVEHGFSKERVIHSIEKISNKSNSNQKSLEDWF